MTHKIAGGALGFRNPQPNRTQQNLPTARPRKFAILGLANAKEKPSSQSASGRLRCGFGMAKVFPSVPGMNDAQWLIGITSFQPQMFEALVYFSRPLLTRKT